LNLKNQIRTEDRLDEARIIELDEFYQDVSRDQIRMEQNDPHPAHQNLLLGKGYSRLYREDC